MSQQSEREYRTKLAMAVEALTAVLSSRDGLLRQTARRSLVAIGELAVEALVRALRDQDKHVRWEAAKALAELADPAAAPALVTALNDRAFGVRWLAAEGLITMGRSALEPLLQALQDEPDSPRLREGTHHVLRVLASGGLHDLVWPLVEALESAEDTAIIVAAAHSVLDAVRREQPTQRTDEASAGSRRPKDA